MNFIVNWFNKLWIYAKTFGTQYTPENPTAPTVQEDIRSKEEVRKFIKSFEQQKKELNIRALKPHECADPLSCTKKKCFTWEPDKIVRKMKVRSLNSKKK